MTTHIAVSLEFRQGGYAPQGPGDGLRLVHCLRHPSLASERINLLVPPSHRLNSLVPATSLTLLPEQPVIGPVGEVRIRDLEGLVAPFVYKSSLTRVIHTFLGIESPIPWNEVPFLNDSTLVTRQRIDSTKPRNSLLFWSRWVPPSEAKTTERVIAVYLRKMETAPERNTPDDFVEICRNVAKANKYDILWCGSLNAVTARSDERVLEATGLSFQEQIVSLRKTAQAAVGWNSGGLDLASAAGLPVLRVGEFQAHGPICEEPKVQRQYRWGAVYNSFLACATNVGLTPCHLDAAKFPMEVLAASMQSFLKNVSLLEAPHHAILPFGEALQSSQTEISLQLHRHEVKWPGAT